MELRIHVLPYTPWYTIDDIKNEYQFDIRKSHDYDDHGIWKYKSF